MLPIQSRGTENFLPPLMINPTERSRSLARFTSAKLSDEGSGVSLKRSTWSISSVDLEMLCSSHGASVTDSCDGQPVESSESVRPVPPPFFRRVTLRGVVGLLLQAEDVRRSAGCWWAGLFREDVRLLCRTSNIEVFIRWSNKRSSLTSGLLGFLSLPTREYRKSLAFWRKLPIMDFLSSMRRVLECVYMWISQSWLQRPLSHTRAGLWPRPARTIRESKLNKNVTMAWLNAFTNPALGQLEIKTDPIYFRSTFSWSYNECKKWSWLTTHGIIKKRIGICGSWNESLVIWA